MALFPEIADAKNINQAVAWVKTKTNNIARVASVQNNKIDFAEELLVPNADKSFYDGAIEIVGSMKGMGRWRKHIFTGLAETKKIDKLRVATERSTVLLKERRAALIAADHVAIPLAPDLFSLKGLQNLGPRLREWRSGWTERLLKRPAGLDLPMGSMDPLGYVVMQHAARLDRPVKAYAKWMARIPAVYREAVRGEVEPQPGVTISKDPYCLSTLKHYRSLMPLAQDARKPMFFLKPADGAIGGHAKAVRDCYQDFRVLAVEVAKRAGVTLP